MRNITRTQGLIGGITISALSFFIYQGLSDQNTLNLSSEKSSFEEVTIITQPETSINTSSISSSSTNAISKADNDEIAYQTPSTFPNGPFAPSIEDTEIDGSLKADANGNLIIDLATRDLFDYFMNTVADVPPEVAIAELEKLARAHLPENAVNQAMRLLGDYLLYKETALSYSNQALLPADQQDENYQLRMLEESFNTLKEIRRNTMSSDAVDAFFGLEEAYGEFTLASIKIQKNPDLSPEQMHLELQAQRELLPEVIRNTENRMVSDIENSQEINELLLSDQRDSEIESVLRNKGLDDEAINDALEYRKQQREFEQQYTLYKKERDQLLSAGLSETDLQSQKERLLEKYFDSEQTQTQAKVKDLSS